MNRFSSTRLIHIAAACTLLAVPSHAGGLYLSVFGTPSMGTASAGSGAIASDASTAFYNSAGMTRLDDHQSLLGLAPGFGNIEFDADDDTPTPGSDGGNQGGFLPISSSSYVHKISDRWRFGLNLFSVSGASLNPKDGWTGRNEITESNLFTLSLLPSFGVRLTDWLSVGAGAIVTYGRLDIKLRAPFPALGEPTVELKDLTDWAAAPTASILLSPTERLRFGLTYNGETKLQLDGDIDIPIGIPTPDVTLEIPLARAVRASVYWETTETLALMMSGGWEDWSTAKDLPLSTGAASKALPLKFRDTWYLAAGVHYRIGEKWLLQTGFRYDSSALKDGDRTTAFPIDRVLTYGVGGKYAWSENLSIGIHFTYADLGKAPVDDTFVKGKYKHNDLFLFGVSFDWKRLPWSGRATL